MPLPPSRAQLNQARRNQAFPRAAMAMAGCGLSAAEVAIFPVRYAVDESPAKGNQQGPNPLPKGWSNTPPALRTRSYTLRQLRDGWLYVWNSTDQTFHEYSVSGHQFTRHLWTDAHV
ncbi:toxin VasX, partial [Pseudomonas sp. RP23018S]|uniref:toxin VasX n=1 Tax=Pseudomonas sp. RP23018S TaxID=3096037 RepID=UPI002ACAC9CD